MVRPGGAPPRAALHWDGKIDGAYGEAVLRTRVPAQSRGYGGWGVYSNRVVVL